jgi:hypothetical protein
LGILDRSFATAERDLRARITSNLETNGMKARAGDLSHARNSRRDVLSLCVERQAAAVRMFLGFFRLGFLSSAERS